MGLDSGIFFVLLNWVFYLKIYFTLKKGILDIKKLVILT